MRTPFLLLIAVSAGALDAGQAQAATHPAPRRGLDMTTVGPSVAAQAAQAAKAPAPAVIPAAPAETVTSGDVSGLTVRPEQRGVVIASSNAASLASPDFTAADAQNPPLAVGIGGNTALGRKVLPNDPPPAGLLHTNPELMGSPVRGEIGISSVF